MTDTNSKQLSDEELLQKKLDLLPGLFRLVDSENEHESFAAVRQIKKALTGINSLQQKITGENPELTFGKLYALIDANAGVDADQFQALVQENEALRTANQQFAAVEEKYKETITAQEKTIENLTTRKPDEDDDFYAQIFGHSRRSVQSHHVNPAPQYQQSALDILQAFSQNSNSMIQPRGKPSGPKFY